MLDAYTKGQRTAATAIDRITSARNEGKAFPYSTAVPFAHASEKQDLEVREIARQELARKYGAANVQVALVGAGWLRIEVRE